MPIGSVYSNLKPAWHLQKIQDLRDGKRIVPSQVQLIISDLCNQDCHFCSYRMDGGFSSQDFKIGNNHNPDRRIPKEKVFEILDDCKTLGIQAIQFTGGGEPTVHKDHLEIFGYAQSLGLRTALVTNGVRIYENEVYRRMDWLRVSLDAGSSKTYNAIRRSDTFYTVIKNLESVCSTKGRGVVGVGFVVTPENYTEIVEATKYALSVGADYIRLSAMFSEEGTTPYDPIYDSIKESILEAKTFESKSFKVFDLFGDRIEDLRQGRPEYDFCGYQFFNVYIGGNLKVYRCCTTSYTPHGEVGDLSQQRFKDWFENSEGAYFMFDARSCHHCQFNDKNQVINYLISEPTHVDFV